MSDEPAAWIGVVEERVRRNAGRVMFAARWIMAPIYLGLLVALALIVVKFVQKLVLALPKLMDASSNEVIFDVLTLVDLSLVANLIVIVMFAGWENFVGRLLTTQAGERPVWLGALDFSALKLRLVASVAVIAAVLILETFVHIDEVTALQAGMQLAILLGIGLLGVLLALMDRLADNHEDK
jgi:uncharacterized protein (TIGR00645 family)